MNTGIGREIICFIPFSISITSDNKNGGFWYDDYVQNCSLYKSDLEKIMKQIIKSHKNRRK
jgi:hypothetical protein